MEDFEKKLIITDETASIGAESSSKVVALLRRFVAVQERRARAYSTLKRGFEDYVVSGSESNYQQICRNITAEFSDCSKQVLEMESVLLSPDLSREDLAHLLRSVQTQEKQKLQLTATIQVLKRAGRPSERLVTHDNCVINNAAGHECVHISNITEGSGTEEAEADAEYENAMKEAVQGVQEAVIIINEHLEEVRYEIASLESE